MGQSSSTSSTSVSNYTSTFSSNIANAFNNALNTTQNFQNIGGVTTPSQSGAVAASGGSGLEFNVNYGLVFAAIGAIFGVYFLFKRNK